MPAHRRHGPRFGADGTVSFRLWAPHAAQATLGLGERSLEMRQLDHGWHVAVAKARHGERYGFALDGGPERPDPASRHQPDGVHNRSALVDPARFPWSATERDWRPPPLASAAIYELHIGTFTPAGTFAAAAQHLGHLRDLGITHVEVMPVNAFNGVAGWGYDGVSWYAVHEPYGGPAGFAAFVDACHRAGLAVILDVVHNHLGPSGNYLPEFGPYLGGHGDTDWGDALNLDGPGSDPVRGFIIGNALAWLTAYHVDALRLDAVHALVDTSAVHVLAELSEAVEALGRQVGRRLELIAESDRNDPQTVRPRAVGGLGLDAQWADDLHHAIHVSLTGERDGYYADYGGVPDVAEAYTRGFVYDGERFSVYRDRTPGAPLGDVPGTRLVGCIQNHDQVGNRALGERLTVLVDAARLRVGAVLLCAAPHVPMLFMGEEFGEERPFRYFSSHPEPELAEAVRAGRAAEFAAFASFQAAVPDPQWPETLAASRLDWSRADTAAGRAWLALWRDLLAARRAHPALANGRRDLVDVLEVGHDRLALVRRDPAAPAVLVAANLGDGPARFADLPLGGAWRAVVDTGAARYGGTGTAGAPGRQLTLAPAQAVLWAHLA
jgi:maltooligosyltrehalose trehalohydrolase